MARRNVNEEEVRSIQKSKRSYYITLPIADVRALRWREGQKVRVRRTGKKLAVTDWTPREL